MCFTYMLECFHWKAGGASKEAEDDSDGRRWVVGDSDDGVDDNGRCTAVPVSATVELALVLPHADIVVPRTFRDTLRDVLRAIKDENGALV